VAGELFAGGFVHPEASHIDGEKIDLAFLESLESVFLFREEAEFQAVEIGHAQGAGGGAVPPVGSPLECGV